MSIQNGVAWTSNSTDNVSSALGVYNTQQEDYARFDAAEEAALSGATIGSDAWLKGFALSQGFLLKSTPPIYDATFGTLTSSTIQWPDGINGVYTATTLDANGAVTAFTATYVGSPTKTVTVTIPRDASSVVNAPMTAVVS